MVGLLELLLDLCVTLHVAIVYIWQQFGCRIYDMRYSVRLHEGAIHRCLLITQEQEFGYEVRLILAWRIVYCVLIQVLAALTLNQLHSKSVRDCLLLLFKLNDPFIFFVLVK